ncbi:MAG: hypothetical protein LC623_01410 [Halobacteriales archaeon]|nr:hypothetical protein [Halobacteriales archaeon]
MAAPSARWALLLLLTATLAGCSASNGTDGQSASSRNALAYNGASGGQQKTSFECDGSGTVSVSANLGMGSVTFTVKDDGGATVYSKTISNTGQAADSKAASGAAGTWALEAERAGGYGAFSGQYAVHVEC